MQRITPFLWFDGQAEEAATFYTSLFAGSRIVEITRYGDGAPMPAGTVLTVAFELEGQRFVGLSIDRCLSGVRRAAKRTSEDTPRASRDPGADPVPGTTDGE